MKRKFWIGFGDYENFSKKDRTMFYVVPADGNSERRIDRTAYIEGEDPKQIRDALVAEIDKWYEHEIHMISLEKRCQQAQVRQADDSALDKTRTSLSIESLDSAPTHKPKPTDDLFGLLDLETPGGQSPVC
jgi:hypothetical protein